MIPTVPEPVRRLRSAALRATAALIALVATRTSSLPAQQAAHVIVVTVDGVRWHEVFGGAQADLLQRRWLRDSAETTAAYWRAAPEERRELLMPFLWSVMARQGQIFGDSLRGAGAYVTNGLWFSYPGYSELLAGVADARIDSNDKVPNPNVTVLEYLNGRPCCRNRVAAFGSWDVLPFILNAPRSRLPVNGDGVPIPGARTERERLINEMSADLPLPFGEAVRLDAPTMQAAQQYLRDHRPAVLYVMLGETDEWAHDGRYDLYLGAIRRADRYIERLWTWAQGTPGYAGRTTLLVTTDHGRGLGRAWTDHGRDVPAARRIWIAALGPGVPALGVREGVEVRQAQVAATIAAALGESLRNGVPTAAPPLPLR